MWNLFLLFFWNCEKVFIVFSYFCLFSSKKGIKICLNDIDYCVLKLCNDLSYKYMNYEVFLVILF